MNLLMISTRLPHAKSLGGHFVVYQRLCGLLRRGHAVELAVFESPDDEAHLPEWEGRLTGIQRVPLPPRIPRGVSTPPAPFSKYASDAMRRCVGDLVEAGRHDLVLAEFSAMGQFLDWNPHLPAVRKIISVHHAYSLIARKFLRLHPLDPRLMGRRLAYRRLERFEFRLYRCADRLLVLTPEERRQMGRIAPDLNMTVIPSGVDTNFFCPRPPPREEDGEALIFTGDYRDEANRDAVRWFLQTMWRLVKRTRPGIRFLLVGPGPTTEMREWARQDPALEITGEVDDVRPYLARARVYVCAMRLGSGMRNKLLEAMAMGVPVVSTSLGMEGIPLQMGEQGFLADRPEMMAAIICLLLSDPVLRDRIAGNARDLVVDRFSWERGAEQLETVLSEVSRRR